MEVTVKAGTTLKQLNQYLDSRGLAMKNLGSITEQTVAGAISTGVMVLCVVESKFIVSTIVMCVCFTGTHGNGLAYGNLATLVTRLQFVNGKGEVHVCIGQAEETPPSHAEMKNAYVYLAFVSNYPFNAIFCHHVHANNVYFQLYIRLGWLLLAHNSLHSSVYTHHIMFITLAGVYQC